MQITATLPDSNPYVVMELSQKEQEMILKMRAEAHRQWLRTHNASLILNTAARYHTWLVQNGAGDTYSTFCDDFGFEEPLDGMTRSAFHSAVMGLIDFAYQRQNESGL